MSEYSKHERRFMRGIFAFVLIVMLTGCGILPETDRLAIEARGHDPWWDGEHVARGFYSTRTTPMDAELWLDWVNDDGDIVDSRDVTADAESWMRSHGHWYSGTDPNVVPVRLTIVVLDPLVIVISDGSTPYSMHRLPHSRERDHAGDFDGILTRGFRCGTWIPESAGVAWFSPSISESIQFVELDHQGNGVIDVGVDRFLLQREMSGWSITRPEDSAVSRAGTPALQALRIWLWALGSELRAGSASDRTIGSGWMGSIPACISPITLLRCSGD